LESGNITDGNSLYVQNQIYDRLIHVQPGKTELMPGLATAWSVAADGLTWTFQLRSGVKFHDGTDFNARAVATNVERWWDPKHPLGFRNSGKTYQIWKNLFGGFKSEPDSLLQAIRVVDDFTVVFVLKRPFAAFPAVLSSGYFGIASPTAIQQAGKTYGLAGATAVGTGPFVFQEWRRGDRIVLTRNPHYWQPDLPKMEQLVVRFMTEPAARLAELRAGTIDMTVDLAPDQRSEVAQDPNLKVVLRPSLNVGYLALNPSYKPLADVRVRQAIAYAINRPEIVQAFWGDLAQTDKHFLPPALKSYQSNQLGQYAFNPQQAQHLLKEAGYPQGFELELWYMPVSRPYYPNPKPIAEAFAADLSAIGLKVTLRTKDWAAYLSDRNTSPGFQAFMLGWTADYSDPDNFLYPHFGPGATADLGNWRQQRILSLLEAGRQSQDPPERRKIYREIDQLLFRELVRLPIVHSQPMLAQRVTLQNWLPSPLGAEPLAWVSKP
jgi:peptide/nickel transport system substrate-binding protein